MGDEDSEEPRRSKKSMLPQKPEGGLDIKKLVTYIGYASAILSVLSGLISGAFYVKARLDAIDDSSTDISVIKEQAQAEAQADAEMEARLSKQIKDLADATRDRFRANERSATDMRVAIAAMQAAEAARHGRGAGYIVAPPSMPPPSHDADGDGVTADLAVRPARPIRPADSEREAQRALIRSSNQAPRGDPLGDL